MRRTALRALLAVLLVGAIVCVTAPWLQRLGSQSPVSVPAPETRTSPAAPTARPVPAEAPWDEHRMSRWIGEAPGTVLLLWLPRALCALLGVLFLVQELLRPEKIRHGLLPAPDGLGPTVVMSPGGALGLAALFALGVPIAAQALFQPEHGDVRFGVATMTAALLPPAVLVALRRWRLGSGRAPGPAAAVGHGLRFLCIAILLVVPATLLWALALQVRGVDLHIQDTVQRFAQPRSPDEPWLIAIFGALVAPFTEEAVFRGLLYPSLRGRIKGGPLGAAVVVALLFAVIHGNLLAFVPLFVLALVLCWVMERTNSLLACVVVHAGHNSLSLAPLLWRHVHGGST